MSSHMNRLFDRGSRETKMRHTLKHFFSLQENYWGLLSDMKSWFARWNTLRAGQALNPELPSLVEHNGETRRAAETGYGDWFALAERAVNEAEQAGQVFAEADKPGSFILVGSAGLVVIASQEGAQLALHTSYRCVPAWRQRLKQQPGSTAAWEAAALAKVDNKVAAISDRTAVRRALRRALDVLETAAAPVLPPRESES